MRNYLIPHKKNDYKPYILRPDRLWFVLSIVLMIELIFGIIPYMAFRGGGFTAEVISQVLVDGTNTARAGEQLATLSVSEKLIAAAQAKANDMAARGYFSHQTPDGKTPWAWLDEAHYVYRYAGENLAVNFYESQDVTNAWLNSPGHRANIMNKNFSEIGIAMAHGQYQGRDSIFVVEFFGRPGILATLAVAAPPETAPASAPAPAAQKPVAVVQPVQPAEPEVAGEETSVVPPTQLMTTTNEEVQPLPSQVAGQSDPDANPIQQDPRGLVYKLLAIIAFVVVIAAILKLCIKFERGHAHLLVNALVVLVVIGLIIVFNYYLFAASGSIF